MPTVKEAMPEVTGFEWVKLLFEVTRRLIQFESIDQVVPAILEIISDALPLRTAVLIADIGEGSVVRAWRAEDVFPSALTAAEVRSRTFYVEHFDERDLAGTSRADSPHPTVLRRMSNPGYAPSAPTGNRFVTLPLAIRDRPVFGTLQLETLAEVDENHLTVLSIVANHLSLALDQFAASRREVRVRERAQSLEHQAIASLRNEEAARGMAEEAIRTRDQFLALVSHDLNDLMSAATLTSDYLLNMRAWDPAEWRQHAEGFAQSVKLMRALLRDLIDTAALEKEQLSVFPRPHPVAPLVGETVDTYRALAETKQVHILSDVPTDLPAVSTDGNRFQQILGNLVKNAIKFSRAKDTVTVKAQRDGDHVHFAVTDRGPGIPAANRGMVFGRSWQGQSNGPTGHGLGLFIAQTLVERHGGRIGFESEPEQGSTFWFTIPIAHI
jgi:signal transduction histidine kinase